jgi:hypothetical protein
MHIYHGALVLRTMAIAEDEGRSLDLTVTVRTPGDGLVVESNGDQPRIVGGHELVGRRAPILITIAPQE